MLNKVEGGGLLFNPGGSLFHNADPPREKLVLIIDVQCFHGRTCPQSCPTDGLRLGRGLWKQAGL